MRIAFVSTYPPRRCGIATFTSDLMGAMRQAEARTQARVAAIDERNTVRAYGSEVRWRIRQGGPVSYMAAAREIDRSNADVVCVQHEFGLYGLWKGGGYAGEHWIEGTYEDHLTPFLEELKKPALVTMHTVLPEPSPAIRTAVPRSTMNRFFNSKVASFIAVSLQSAQPAPIFERRTSDFIRKAPSATTVCAG